MSYALNTLNIGLIVKPHTNIHIGRRARCGEVAQFSGTSVPAIRDLGIGRSCVHDPYGLPAVCDRRHAAGLVV